MNNSNQKSFSYESKIAKKLLNKKCLTIKGIA